MQKETLNTATAAKHVSLFSLSSIVPKIAGIFLLPIYTRFLTPSDYGILALAGTLGSILGVLFPLGTQGALSRFYFDYKRKKLKELVGSLIIMQLILIISAGCIGLAVGPFIKDYIGRKSELNYFGHLFPQILIAGLGTIPIYAATLMRARLQSFRFSIFHIANFLLGTLVSIAAVVFLNLGASGIIWGKVATALLFFVVSLFICSSDLSVPQSLQQIKRALIFGLPLVPAALFGFVNQWFDRLVIARYRPLSELGLYSMGYAIGFMVYILSQALGRAWPPLFFQSAKNSNIDSKTIKTITNICFWLFLFTLVTSLFAPEALLLLTTPKYHSAVQFVPIIAISYVFNALYMFPAACLHYAKQTKIFPVASGIAAACNIILNFLFVPRFGAISAAFTTLAAFAILFAIVHFKAQSVYPLRYDYIKIALLLLLMGGMVAWGHICFRDFKLVNSAIKAVIAGLFLGAGHILGAIDLRNIAVSAQKAIARRI